MSTLLSNDRWQERAAILTYDTKLPEPIAEAAAVIYCIPPPAEITTEAWAIVMDILGRGLDDYAQRIRESTTHATG
jgi:hypothetical protein